jgi:hypothetical protein
VQRTEGVADCFKGLEIGDVAAGCFVPANLAGGEIDGDSHRPCHTATASNTDEG